MELAPARPVWIFRKGIRMRSVRIDGIPGRFLLVRLVRFAGHHILDGKNAIGRKIASSDARSRGASGQGKVTGPPEGRNHARAQSDRY